ncbi:class I SAM-dependent DNA methyltransferase [Paenirhodobacter enshiensis]|uniref:Methyltransferase type 12 domain-containing protein n=1 Tax=Paenirhodobacter enshiensis TaxID=1105367 RepID=A0A086XRC6_9RHOB|nr:methyltransferase [Paenirhodobacter enshiensis]KFI24576.1 hypothetical protein CG50_09610 [Paenirhodobacter enshiensis]
MSAHIVSPVQFCSGDLLADRRAEFAEGLVNAGDPGGAAELYRQALEIVPGWGAGWYRLGEICAHGALAGAREAFAEALRLDPDDTLGAGLQIALLDGRAGTARMPSAFVETLFDQYAGHFDHALVDTLGYRGPQLLEAQLGGGTWGRALDLGCGTGLMGEVLRARSGWLEGWDISAEMLREAGAKRLYDRLEKCDLSRLDPPRERWDLIAAADVFSYLGELSEILSWCHAALDAGGVLAFTAEATTPEEARLGGCVLRESRRYAHAEAALIAELSAAGFSAEIGHGVLRMDRGVPIAALAVVARRL